MPLRALLQNIRLVLSEGIFGGVSATDTLTTLTAMAEKGQKFPRLVYQAVVSGKGWEEIDAEKGGDLAKAILAWPSEFRAALRAIDEVPFDSKSLAFPSPDAAAQFLSSGYGIGPEVLIAWRKFRRAVHKSGKVESPPDWRKLLMREVAKIDTTLRRYPPKLEAYLRKTVIFKPEALREMNPKATKDPEKAQAFEAAFQEMKDRFDLRVKAPVTNFKASGVWRSDSRSLWLRDGFSPTTVAHELGHALWEDMLTPAMTRTFFGKLIEDEALASTSAEEFLRRFREALDGMASKRTFEAVTDAVKNWGAGYVVGHGERTLASWSKQQGHLVEQKDLLAKLLVGENKAILGAWGEIWAEAFARVIRGPGVRLSVRVPNAVIRLVEWLLWQ